MSQLVHAIGHVKINTTVTEAVVREATEILGLRVTYSDAHQTWLSSNGRAAELVLLRARENATHTIGLEALTVDAVRQAEARVEAAGCRVLSQAEPRLHAGGCDVCNTRGIVFRNPHAHPQRALRTPVSVQWRRAEPDGSPQSADP
jgi:catechol 2,3-dioxygenase